MPRFQAERMVFDGDLSGYDLDQLEQLMLSATGGDAQAAKRFKMQAYKRRLWAASERRE